MSKYLNLILGLVLLFSISIGCDSTPKNSTDLDRENLKGDVILTDTDGEIVFYDSLGNLSKTIEPGKISIVSKYIYVNNKLSFREQSSPLFKTKTAYLYDKNGILIQSENQQYFKLTTDFEKFGDVFKNYFRFDENKNLILDSVNNKLFNKYYFTKNLMDSSLTVMGESITKSYFKDGNEIKKIAKSETGVVINTFEYLLDPEGNWIQQKTLVDGKETKVTNRRIFYKGQDITEFENRYNVFATKEKNSNSGDNSVKSRPKLSKSYQNQEKTKSRCNFCDGRGDNRCSRCDGRGFQNSGKACSICDATGRRRCTWCDGSGFREN